MDWGSGADVSSGFESFRARWESKTRWYEVEFSEDLFGTWLLTRRWGALASGRNGSIQELPQSPSEVRDRLDEIARRRSRAGSTYVRVL